MTDAAARALAHSVLPRLAVGPTMVTLIKRGVSYGRLSKNMAQLCHGLTL